MKLTLNRPIPYTYSWRHTLTIAIIVGSGLSILLIFLQPFDTASVSLKYKTLKLAGYGLCFVLPILGFHGLENKVYNGQKRRWYIVNELIYIICCLSVVFSFCYLYNNYVVNDAPQVSVKGWGYFMLYYGLPFLPILGPIWLYFRNKFGKIEIDTHTPTDKEVIISGDNKSESIKLFPRNFVFAQAQQNYVEVSFIKDEVLEQQLIRSTLSSLQKQLPEAWQVHRSYLVNLDYLKRVSGNSRKREMHFTIELSPIPVSQKYFTALEKHLTNSSQ